MKPGKAEKNKETEAFVGCQLQHFLFEIISVYKLGQNYCFVDIQIVSHISHWSNKDCLNRQRAETATLTARNEA